MALAIWPTGLPQRFTQDGYSETLRDGRLRAKTDSGAGRGRRRFSSAAMPVKATLLITFAQKGMLESFYYETLQGGSLPFKMPDQSHDDFALLDTDLEPLLDSDDVPLLDASYWLVLFGEAPPQFTPLGGEYWNAILDLSVLP